MTVEATEEVMEVITMPALWPAPIRPSILIPRMIHSPGYISIAPPMALRAILRSLTLQKIPLMAPGHTGSIVEMEDKDLRLTAWIARAKHMMAAI